jgi:hypothetical protein
MNKADLYPESILERLCLEVTPQSLIDIVADPILRSRDFRKEYPTV